MMHEEINRARAIPAETLALMVELLPTVNSLRDLRAITGLRLETVRRETAPFRALMKLNGTHPKCGCGKDRFHPYGCSAQLGDRSHQRSVSAEQLIRRQRIVDAIVAGQPFEHIGRRHGLTRQTVRAYLKYLTPEQLAARHAIRPLGPTRRPKPQEQE